MLLIHVAQYAIFNNGREQEHQPAEEDPMCNRLSFTERYQSHSRSELPFLTFLFVYFVSVASITVVYSITRKYQKQLSFVPCLALPSLDLIVHLLGSPCILFDDWFSTKTQTQTDRRTDRLAQTNTDGQTDNSLCCVLCQRRVPLGALGELTFATGSQRLYKEARLYPFRSYALMNSRLTSPSSLLPLLLLHLSPSSALV
jgi:hypothetical protein